MTRPQKEEQREEETEKEECKVKSLRKESFEYRKNAREAKKWNSSMSIDFVGNNDDDDDVEDKGWQRLVEASRQNSTWNNI